MTALLGVDLGTSGVKALLLGEDGRILREAAASYPPSTPRPGWSEQKPSDWWDGTCRAVRHVLDVADGVDVAALALSGQMHGATLLDRRGEVLRPAILWNDQRTGAECDEITERIGLDQLVRWVANPALAGFTAPKILWVRSHEPDVYGSIDKVLLPKDYINYRLTGEAATEVSDASGTLLFDVARRRWSEEQLNALQIPDSFLPPVHASTDVVGQVTRAAAEATGLTEGTPVVAGGADNACAAVGMGVVGEGQVLTSIGTSGTVVAPSSAPRVDPEARLHMFCHAVPDTWYLMGVVLSAGGSLQWFVDTLMDAPDPYAVLEAEVSAVPPGSEGLIFLPYLSGERTPHADPNARGVFLGLSLAHGRGHLARSIMEGVTFALADSVAIMRDLGIEVDAVLSTGGAARSGVWRQIQADVLRARIATALGESGPAFGAAIIAGTGVGVFSSIPDAVKRLVQIQSQTEPDEERADLYRRYHDFYGGLYPLLKSSFSTLASLEDVSSRQRVRATS